MFYGMKFYNDLLMEAGPSGTVQSEVLLQKDKETFSFKQGWAFPRKVYFNGDECMLPPPDTYPYLPNFAHHSPTAFTTLLFSLFFLFILLFWSLVLSVLSNHKLRSMLGSQILNSLKGRTRYVHRNITLNSAESLYALIYENFILVVKCLQSDVLC